jgi:hypothetical protein
MINMNGQKIENVKIVKSDKPKYKLKAIFSLKKTGKNKKSTKTKNKKIQKSVYFGARGYSDYTIHKDPERMRRYLSRHKKREHWSGSGLMTAGGLSRWILWSKPNLNDAIRNYKKKVLK